MRRLILLLLVALAAARYVDHARERREVDFHDWLTEAQKSELKMLKESADHAALKKRTMELYELLPAEEKAKWNGKYKEMCVAWIKEVATEEENANYKKWKAEGKMDEITGQYKKLKERLSEEKRKDVELWENECWELWKDEFPASRGRRSAMDLAQEKLAFLGPDKLAELKELKESGASDDVIRDKVVSWTLDHWKSKDTTASTADFVKKCYGWIKDVTQAEEYEAFEKLHHTDHEACRVKVREFLARLPLDKQAEVEKSLPLCDAIWYKLHQEEHGAHAGHDHHAHKHHAKRHLNTMHIERYMGWMSQEQKDEIKKMEAGGESYDALVVKMKEYYNELGGELKQLVRKDLKEKCAEWVYAKATETEKTELQEILQDADKDDLIEFLRKPYARLSEDEKHEVDHTKDMCIALWTTEPESRNRRSGDHAEVYKEYFSWLTPEQAAEAKALREAGKEDESHKKVSEFYEALSGDAKTAATEKLKGACKHFFTDSFGDAAVEELKQMKESGSSMDEIGSKVEEMVKKIPDEKKKAAANRVSLSCKKIFTASRKRRDHHHDDYAAYKEYFTWLTPEQAAEIKTLREAGDEDGINKKVHEYHAALDGDKKIDATEKLKGACKHFFKDVFGEAAVEEIKQMKESGTSMDDIGKKVEELIGKITDDKKKGVATRASVNCKKLFIASRRRRDHHEEYKEYFSWLTPEQGAEIKALKEAGDQEAVYTKIEGYFAALSGDKLSEATEKMKGACKHFFKKAFGEDAVEEVKQMKESGSSMDEIGKKVEEFIAKITDEKKKTVATRASINCKKVFSASRRRRDHHHDEYAAYKEYFSWLTPEQAAEIKTLKEAGDTAGINKKVQEFHGALTGEKLAEATEKLKGACKHFFKDNLGEAAVEEVKQMKESSTSMDEIGKKVEELIAKITDEKKKTAAAGVSATCKKVFSASRKRREPTDEFAAYKQYFTWLTPEQAAEIKALREGGDEDAANKKVQEMYAALAGDKKNEATEKLKGACKHFFKDVFGEAAVEELKQMKESGTSMDDIGKKVEELIGKIADDKKKATATRASLNCKKLFGASRRRRDDKHTIDEHMDEFLPWLSDVQKDEIKALKEAGDDKIGEKILEFFDSVDAAKKDEARGQLQAGCRHFLAHLIGPAAAEEMKALKETGASNADMAAKLETVIANMPEGADKKKALGMSKNCKKVYGMVSRRRRHEHTLEESFTEFLPWITEEQKMEIKNMKESGAQDKIGEKVMEYYEGVSEDKKDEARVKLQAGCRHFLKHLLGDSVSAEMKAMHESGSSPADMAKKLDEIIGKMEDGEKKAKAVALSKNCRKVYGVDARKKRNLYGEFDTRYHQYYNWLEDEQRDELAELQDSGMDSALLEKVSEYFKDLSEAKKEEARGQLKMGCRMRMRDLLGEEKAEEIRRMKDEGATRSAMLDRVAQFVEEMEEGTEKESAKRSYTHCAKILGRQRRAHEAKKELNLADYTTWLTTEQRQQLNAIIRSETISSDDIYSKLFEFVDELEGEKKMEATKQMRGACKFFRTQFIGASQESKLIQMRETGKKWSEIEHVLDGMIAAIEDESKRRKARAAMDACKKLYQSAVNN